ncbi:TolB family protein [Spirillospora sp. CA-128828]|uniref:TolB family protein n=1 Tax=Spirillospora sp. CA-128828 TaxID=3240033 RepID=UPI003D8EACBC
MDEGRREDPGTRLGSWKGLVPLGMAAAAALFIGGGVDVVHRHQRAADEEHDAKPAAKAEKTEPLFVVGVTKPGTALVVRDVHTGANVGLPVAAPEGRRFHRVAAAKDGSYVVASYGDHKVTFQRLRLDGHGRPKDLKDIPNATVPGVSTAWSDLSLSPDGDHIAYVTYRGARSRVDVVSPKTGTHKAWTTKLRARVGSLSWSGATLSFVWSSAGSARHQVRTLDTNGAAGDLRVSKAVMLLPRGSSNAVLSRDGNSLIVAVAKKSELTLQTYTLQGKPIKALWTQKVKGELTGLDVGHTGGVIATAGDLYAQGVPAVPGEDLADAAW